MLVLVIIVGIIVIKILKRYSSVWIVESGIMAYEEKNTVLKSVDDVDIRLGLISPNDYNLAMQTLGYHLLYQMLNEREDCFCERIIYPDVESIETNTSLKEFDILSFTIHYTFSYFNLVDMLKKSGVQVLRKDRTNDDPLIIAGGPIVTANPMPLSDFIDIFFIGDGEYALNDFLDLYNKFENPREHLEEFAKIEGLYVPELNNRTNIALVEDMDKKFHVTKPVIADNNEQNRINWIRLEVARGCSRGCRFCMSGYLYRPLRETSVERLVEIAEKTRENTGFSKIFLSADAIADYSRIDELISSLQQRGFNIELASSRIESITKESLKQLKQSGGQLISINPESIDRIRKSINKDIPENLIQNVVEYAFELGLNLRISFMLGFSNETEADIIELAEYIKSIVKTKNSINKDLSIKVKISLFVPKPQTSLQWDAYDLDLMESKVDLFMDQFDDMDLQFLKYSQIDMNYLDEENNLKLSINSNEPAFKDYILSFAGPEIGELLLNGNLYSPISEWKKYFKKYDVGDSLPWDTINLGYLNNFLEKEYGRFKKGKLTPWCGDSPCYNCKDICYLNPKLTD